MQSLSSLLLVDDDSFSRYASKLVIRKSGLAQEIIEAGNGQEALDILMQNLQAGTAYPDMILLDWQMPVMDGATFLEELQLTQKPVSVDRIVVISSMFSASQMKAMQAFGIKWFLNRPLTEESLRQILHKWMVTV